MEYRREFRDNLQPIRSELVRFPTRSSIALAALAAAPAAVFGVHQGGIATGVSYSFWAAMAGVAVASWFNRPLVRWLTPPTIAFDLDGHDPEPKGYPADAEVLAQRTQSFVQSYFHRKSATDTVFAGGRPLDELNAAGYCELENRCVYVDRPTFIDASEWLNQVHSPKLAWSTEKYLKLRQSTGALFLLYLHEFIHSASNPIGDIPAAWTEGVTELATRTAASRGLKAVRLPGIDDAIGITQTDKYDRYVAAISLVVLEVASLTDTRPEVLIQGLVLSGCNRQGVKRFCAALARTCQIDNAGLEEQLADVILAPFEKLKPGGFGQIKKNDLAGVRDALSEVRFLLWLNGMSKQPPAVPTRKPYSRLLKEIGQAISHEEGLAA